MNLFIKTRLLRPNFINSLSRYSNTTSETVEQNEQVIIDDSVESLAREAEIEKKRNKSRLSQAHQNLIHGQRPYETARHLSHLTVKYNRTIYGKYGSESGVNPSLCWPTKKDIEETLEYESVAFPYTIKEMMDTAAQKRQETQYNIAKRESEIAAKFVKLEQLKKEIKDKVAKKSAEVEAAKMKKERLVEEVRRHFGFTLDPRDERFQEMLAKREKEQKKIEKLAKKDAKEKLLIAKLQQKNIEINDAPMKS